MVFISHQFGIFLSAGKVELLKAVVQDNPKDQMPGCQEQRSRAGEGQTFPGMKKFPDGKKLPACPGKVYN